MTATTEPTLGERIGRLHEMGLDRRYDDVLLVEDAGSVDQAAMADGCHFDYVNQEWADGHDHAHYASGASDQGLPLLFCGADVWTCCGIDITGGLEVAK